MQVNSINNVSFNNQSKRNAVQPNFTGGVPTSKLGKLYDQGVEWLANNYYAKLYKSDFAGKFTEKTKKFADNMTTHMIVLGSTVISGMYIMRTLQNDKLDKEKRKTLAINDTLTWAVSTAGTYFVDGKLQKLFNDKISTRYAANFLEKHPDKMNKELLGEWNLEDIRQVMKEAPQRALAKYAEMKKTLGENTPQLKEWMEKVRFPEDRHFKELEGHEIKNIKDFSTDILKSKKLSKMLNGIGVLKSLFIGTMIYRYLVPVLIMKPANKIGAYVHAKNAEKRKAEQAQKLEKTA